MSKWISTQEKLPETGPVLICYLEPMFGIMSQEIGVGYFDHPHHYENPDDGQGWLFWLGDRKVLGGGVTHWMTLPEPPK